MRTRAPVMGFQSHRREGSGTRLYTWAERRFGTAEAFFGVFFIVNYFPLLLLTAEGTNVTPNRLPARVRDAVAGACDPHLAACVATLRPRWLLGFGRYAAEQVTRVANASGLELAVGRLLHPSPASPLANRSWAEHTERELARLGIELPDRPLDS